MKVIDFLIVGQGLAGTNLAFQLLEKGKSVLIVDKLREVTSSKVAAGIINPITGRRFAKTWLAEKLFPFAKAFYRNQEQLLDSKFYNEIPVYRYFSSVEDENTWMGRTTDEDIKPYIGDFEKNKTTGIKNDFGGAAILEGGWLNTKKYLEASREYFIKNDLIVDKDFHYDDLENSSKIKWKDITTNKIIFCEGFRAKDNPFFDWLPFTFAKGEVLELEIDGISNEVLHNKNGFILPQGGNKFKLGATFRWNEMDEKPTERSLVELKEKYHKFSDCKFKVIGQKASIRPTTKDRRPFIGCHPKHKNIYIFNGFGSKGVTLIPYLGNDFINHLGLNTTLNSEVDVRRYY